MGKKQAIKGKDKKPITRDWENMDSNLLLKIFASLSIIDIVMNISSVCTSWRSLCSELKLWKIIDLNLFKFHFKSKRLDRANERGLILFKVALNLGGEHFEKLILDLSSDINDDILLYAAQRCGKKLKELVLPCTQHISYQGLATALGSWESLESLFLSFYSSLAPVTVFEIVGSFCKNLTMLRVRTCYVDIDTTAAITECMPGLKVLSLRSADIKKDSVEILLDKLENLEELYVSLNLVGLQSPFPGPRFLPPIQDQSMLQKVSKLRVFHFCLGYCDACVAVTIEYPSLGSFIYHRDYVV